MVGLIISYKGTNYGMMLQAFATQYVLENLGYKTEIISCGEKRKIVHRLKKVFIPNNVKQSLRKRKRKIIVKNNPVINNAYKMRIGEGKKFVEKYLHNIKNFSNINQLSKYAKKYTAVIIGSDQQWTPECFFSEINSLSFVPASVKKISYATSMGVSVIPWYTKTRLKAFTKDFYRISVREQTGKNIIESVTGKSNVEVMPDPTFLISREEWEEIIPAERICEKDYIFCYLLGDSDEPLRAIEKYAKEKNLEVIVVRNIEAYTSAPYNYGDTTVVEGPSVEEFVNYIRYANLVCTDSFHATVFSLINKTDFITFYRTQSTDKNSRNSRINDLLEKFKLRSRICEKNEEFSSKANEKIDFEKIDFNFVEMKKTGISFLQEALNYGK